MAFLQRNQIRPDSLPQFICLYRFKLVCEKHHFLCLGLGRGRGWAKLLLLVTILFLRVVFAALCFLCWLWAVWLLLFAWGWVFGISLCNLRFLAWLFPLIFPPTFPPQVPPVPIPVLVPVPIPVCTPIFPIAFPMCVILGLPCFGFWSCFPFAIACWCWCLSSPASSPSPTFASATGVVFFLARLDLQLRVSWHRLDLQGHKAAIATEGHINSNLLYEATFEKTHSMKLYWGQSPGI